ncbi:MAG: hypothetical protein HFP76_00900 [Methylococcales symbiont of Iophon sp. n. MRB-2018]|nr:MAG: hypothetical protein HFP76_00900 [Methylococcales symbiont of Iophon sp. n. MRB-2018]
MDDVCDANANCTDTDGSYECRCEAGYTGDGVACVGRLIAVTHAYVASIRLCTCPSE